MPLLTPIQVRASHDIQRFRTIVVQVGSPGRILAQCPDWADTTYTIEFSPLGVPGATIILAGLNECDVHLDDAARSTDDEVIESAAGGL
jgi:hypothetical protein